MTIDKLLTGVQEVGEDYTDRIDEIHGMLDRPHTSLQRLPGKLLATTGLAEGPVWSLHQLRFRDTILMMVHEGTGINVSRETLPPAGRFFWNPNYPMLPETSVPSLIDAPNWPPIYEDSQGEVIDVSQSIEDIAVQQAIATPNLPQSAAAGGGGNGSAKIYVDPFILEFVLPLQEGIFDYTSLLQIIIGYWIQGFGFINITWSGDGLEMWAGQINTDEGRGPSKTTDWIDTLFWGVNGLNIYSIRPAADIADGLSTFAVLFTMVDGYTNKKPLVNPDGSEIFTNLLVNVYKHAFTLTAPASVSRGETFNLEIQSIFPDFVPQGDIDITHNSADLTITPSSTDNSGWSGGAKTVSCVFTGDGVLEDVALTVTDPATEATASAEVEVRLADGFTLSAPVVARNVDFTLDISADGDAAYVPDVNVALSTDAADVFTVPIGSVIDNTGWAGGAKSVTSRLDGGAGGTTVLATALDGVSGRIGSVNIKISEDWPNQSYAITAITSNSCNYPLATLTWGAVSPGYWSSGLNLPYSSPFGSGTGYWRMWYLGPNVWQLEFIWQTGTFVYGYWRWFKAGALISNGIVTNVGNGPGNSYYCNGGWAAVGSRKLTTALA